LDRFEDLLREYWWLLDESLKLVLQVGFPALRWVLGGAISAFDFIIKGWFLTSNNSLKNSLKLSRIALSFFIFLFVFFLFWFLVASRRLEALFFLLLLWFHLSQLVDTKTRKNLLLGKFLSLSFLHLLTFVFLLHLQGLVF
jgi:hypothetical protein